MGQGVECSNVYDRDPSGDVIFSFVDGYVWASWPGSVSMVRVGGYEAAKTAMLDFLAQCEVAERLEQATPLRSVPTKPS